MLTTEKNTLTNIFKKNLLFKNIIEKLTINKVLSKDEKSFILACALIFLQEYNKDRRFKSYADLAYYIILKYSINTSDYKPLYDFSVEFGFFPITNSILQNDLLKNLNFNDVIVKFKLEDYQRTDGSRTYTETLEQNLIRKQFVEDHSVQKGFIAPTSFGKSSIIIQYIQAYSNEDKIAIIVPTKSLLFQTYLMIRNNNLGYKVLMHDEMYDDEIERFICVFTQERALRLIGNKEVVFDVLIIDEAHNVLKSDNRNLLLSRLIRLNTKRKSDSKVVYLSPLIDDIKNLICLDSKESIKSHKIDFNIKCPQVFEYTIDNKLLQHNTFFSNDANKGIYIQSFNDFFDLIKNTSKEKNFIYNYRPIHIEDLARKMMIVADTIVSPEIEKVIDVLKEEVHENFYCVPLLEKGIIYLHGKLPDLVKEYLEAKFSEIPEIKFVIANSVILEGINLPIDSLYIFNTSSLRPKGLVNLIGRVNRLNEIFKEGNNLYKLLPPIYFINNSLYNLHHQKPINMFNRIKELRNRSFSDEVKNPLLKEFNINTITGSTPQDKKRKQENVIKVIENENFIIDKQINPLDKLKHYFIENSFDLFYRDLNKLSNDILSKITQWHYSNIQQYDILERIYYIFIKDYVGSGFIKDYEFYRLNQEKARSFYNDYLKNRRKPLKANVVSLYKSLVKRKESSNSKSYLYYIGSSYGELEYISKDYPDKEENYKVVIDLRTKSDSELVNYAIVKIKIEDDFISFKLNKFVLFLYDYQIISEEEYNEYVYGTTDKTRIELTKYGLSIGLIEQLNLDNQLDSLYFDEYGNLSSKHGFEEYLNTLSDFQRFEIKKYIM